MFRSRTDCQNWSSEEKSLIEIVEQHPVLYVKDPSITRYHFTKARNSAWAEVSTKAKMPVNECNRRFVDIKYKYAKLKQMIQIGRISEQEVRENKKTSKYMDGALDFLDPYLFEILGTRIPVSAHRFFESVFEANPTGEADCASSVDEIQNPVIKIVEVYSQATEIQPMSILPKNENNESETSTNRNKETFFCEHPLEVKVAIYQSIKKEVSEDETAENTLMDFENVEHILPDMEVARDPLEEFLMKYTDDNDEETDMKQYMKDLADVLCSRLAVEKRQPFLNQIDSLVSEVLEG